MGWWPLVDGAGTIAYDGSGNGNDGTLTNMTSADWLTGQTGCPQLIEGYNRPMRFDNPQYIEVPQDSTLDVGTSDFTFAAWTFLETGSEPNIAMQFAGAGGWRMVGAAGKVRFSVFDNGWSNYASMDISPALTLDQWNHIAVSVDRDGSAQSYINGVAKTSLVVSGVTSTLTNAYPLRFGAGSYTNGAPTGDYIAGTINEAIMYIGTALNAADIAALAATGTNGGPLPPDPTTMTYSTTSYSSSYLKGYWRNDGIVTWADRSGNGNTGTANGSPNALLFKQGINGSKNVNTGRDNQGFPLLYQNNGAVGLTQTGGSRVLIPHSSDILWNSTASFTIGVWYKIDSNPSGTYPSIWGKGGQSSSGPGYELFLNPSGTSFTLRTTWSGGPTWGMTAAYSSAGNPMDGKWHYIVAVVDQDSDNACLYYDAAKQTTTDISSAGDPTNTTDLTLGSAGAGLFHGQIAGAQIYNRAITYAEIHQNYNSFKARFGK